MPVGAVQFNLHPVVVMFDEVLSVGGVGLVVTDKGADKGDVPPVFVAATVILCTVLGTRPDTVACADDRFDAKSVVPL